MATQVECTCLECGNKFMKYQSQIDDGRGKYCSRKCSSKARKGYIPVNKGVDNKVTIVCQHCGKEFRVIQSRKDTAKYCSFECRDKGINGINNPNFRNAIVEHVCPICDKTFMGRNDAKYCSIKCKDEAHVEWMKENTPRGEEHQTWKGGWERINKIYAFYGHTFEDIDQERWIRAGFAQHICRTENISNSEYNVHHMYPARLYPMFLIEEFNGIPMNKELHEEFHHITGGRGRASNPGVDWVNELVEFLDKKINRGE